MKKLKGRIALVTGAASGLGKAIAIAFAREGADVRDEESVRSMAEAALARFTRVDVLNNAGIFTESLIENLSIDDWDRVINTNLRGTFLCTRVLIGQMLDRGDGRIINIASQLGQIGGTSIGHYAASKAGIIGLTKSRAREVAARGVLLASADESYYVGQTLGPNGGDVML